MIVGRIISVGWIFFLVAGFVDGVPMGPLTPHFQNYLKKNPIRNNYLIKAIETHGATGSFGGKESDDDEVTRMPILFVHGNSDSALDAGIGVWTSGWTKQIQALLDIGYSSSELYAITYGDLNIQHSTFRQINCRDLMGHRRFLEAILEYTGAKKIKIVSHSMGVSYTRAIAKGGKFNLVYSSCDLGDSLSDRIDTILGISAANYGMCICYIYQDVSACGKTGGFFPGQCEHGSNKYSCGSPDAPECPQNEYSSFLTQLNNGEKEADHVISMWSDDDEILGKGNKAFGRITSRIPNSEATRIFSNLTHFQTKTDTITDQLHYLRVHLP